MNRSQRNQIAKLAASQQVAALAELTIDQLIEFAREGYDGAFFVNTTILAKALAGQAANVSAAEAQLALAAE